MFSGVKDSISSAASSAKDAVSDVASAGKDIAGGIGDGMSKVFDSDIFDKIGVSNIVSGAVDIATGQRSLGSLASSALDSLGLPDWAADIAGVGVDVLTGNKKGAIQQGLEAARGVADAAGIDKAADFLDTAGDVVGMANGSVSSPGDFKAIASETVSSVAEGSVDGLVSSVVSEAGLGAFEETAEVASDLAGYVDSAGDAISAFREGDASALGEQVFDTMGGSAGLLSELMGDRVDTGLFDQLRENIANPTGQVAEHASSVKDAISSAVDAQTTTPGSAVVDSKPGQAYLDSLGSTVSGVAANANVNIDVQIDGAVLDMACTARGCLDMAGLSEAVAAEVADTLEQLGSMSNTGRVGDMISVEVRV